MKKRVGIIGGGIVGLCSAYFLRKEGHEVFIFNDKKEFNDGGASYVNAGYIVPSHFISMANSDMIKKGIKWMFSPSSPFYIKPRFDLDLILWLWYFYKSSNKKKVESSISSLKNINLFSKDLYETILSSGDFSFDYNKNGLLMLYKNESVGEAEWSVGQRAIQEGLDVRLLSLNEVKKLEPKVDLDIKGAVHYLCDAHMTPNQFMSQIKSYLVKQGVIFYKEGVEDFTLKSKTISNIITRNSNLELDEVVLAAGSWSSSLGNKLKISIPLQAGKGYCINISKDLNIAMPAILCEKKVAVTPMNSFTRFSGAMELSGIENKINSIRVDSILDGAKSYYKNLNFAKEELSIFCGLRPCSPDGLAYIGRTKKYKNLTIATGHCMMGWSLGPASGKLVSEIISNYKTSLNLDAFSPDRVF